MDPKISYIGELVKAKTDKIDSRADILFFGARVKSLQTKKLDWEVLILIDDEPTLRIEQALRNGIYDLELETFESFSVFIFSKKDWKSTQKVTPFYRYVLEKNISL